jgi:hypothetical protein
LCFVKKAVRHKGDGVDEVNAAPEEEIFKPGIRILELLEIGTSRIVLSQGDDVKRALSI